MLKGVARIFLDFQAVAEPDKNSEGVKVQSFPTREGGKRVYPDIFIAFSNCNFSQMFESGGVFTPSYLALALPLLSRVSTKFQRSL